ncbi:hypothetical protein PR202_gb15040 [Eleusine coracana subsp. coracana]|uniref:Uncharacterized protein n=1 Tax=Eleusine coracana subsp. coracana TaxID=191504 RepID=A0AAV5EWY1_ELECO|nr:hypothetical protein PR202_gb15040 [Eleusine coracana subsp. coracana]
MKDCLYSPCEVDPTDGDALALGLGVRDGKPIGEPTGSSTVFIVPEGMEKVVMFYKERYNNTPIYIAENGYAQASNSSMTTKDFTNGVGRVKYMRGHLTYLASAIRKGADVRGYFVWTLLDSFEWNLGFTQRYGLHHVDFKTLKRTPELSARWYRMFLKGPLLQEKPENELELHHEE